MEIKLWKDFRKRRNSTKRPTDEDYVIKDVKLKGECSITRPSFFLADAGIYSYLEWNGLYYFITDISWDINNACYIKCQLDYLASWKDEILNTTAFVKYSSSNFSNKIIDQRIARFTDTIIGRTEEDSIFDGENTDNEFVFMITIGGEYSSSAYDGGYNYYAFSETGWNDFCAMMCNGDFEDDIRKIFTDVSSGLISCRRMPIKSASLPTEGVSSIRVGRANIPYPAWKLSSRYIHRTLTMDVPNYQSDFNHWDPYTKLKLYIPFIGAVDLPLNIVHSNHIIIDYVVDLVTGVMDVNVGSNINHKMLNYSTEIGGQLPTSVNNVNLLKVATNGASAIGAAATGNYVGAIAEAAGAITTGMIDNISSKGTFGGGRSEVLGANFILYSIRWSPVFNLNNADFIRICGKPCYKVIPLTDLTGYVETIDFSIELHSTDDVRLSINQLMDSGVYLE